MDYFVDHLIENDTGWLFISLGLVILAVFVVVGKIVGPLQSRRLERKWMKEVQGQRRAAEFDRRYAAMVVDRAIAAGVIRPYQEAADAVERVYTDIQHRGHPYLM